MKLLENRTVSNSKLSFTVRQTNSAWIDFQEITDRNKDIDDDVLTRYDLTVLFFAMAKAGAKKTGKGFDYTFEQFYELVDDYPDLVNDFILIIKEALPEKKKTILLQVFTLVIYTVIVVAFWELIRNIFFTI